MRRPIRRRGYVPSNAERQRTRHATHDRAPPDSLYSPSTPAAQSQEVTEARPPTPVVPCSFVATRVRPSR